jgi:hypothetical protein
MSRYRMTVRIGRPGRQYDMQDLSAHSLLDALRQALERFPQDGEGGDLLEIRLHTDPDQRPYPPA